MLGLQHFGATGVEFVLGKDFDSAGVQFVAGPVGEETADTVGVLVVGRSVPEHGGLGLGGVALVLLVDHAKDALFSRDVVGLVLVLLGVDLGEGVVFGVGELGGVVPVLVGPLVDELGGGLEVEGALGGGWLGSLL